MDTVSLPAGDAKPAMHNITSITSSTRPSVIHDYKVLVKGMVGLMLRLSHEGSSPGLIQNLQSAASSLVRVMNSALAAAVHACQQHAPHTNAVLKSCSSPSPHVNADSLNNMLMSCAPCTHSCLKMASYALSAFSSTTGAVSILRL